MNGADTVHIRYTFALTANPNEAGAKNARGGCRKEQAGTGFKSTKMVLWHGSEGINGIFEGGNPKVGGVGERRRAQIVGDAVSVGFLGEQYLPQLRDDFVGGVAALTLGREWGGRIAFGCGTAELGHIV